MDTIPAQPVQEIPSQQVPIQPVATFTTKPIQELPQKKRSLRKVFNISSWIVLFALLPFTVLIFLSQDSIPGDLFYPVKRSLENVVLAAASVSPATRAAFRTDLTETRFKEAQSLVISKSNASGLSTFIDEVQGTQLEVTNLTSDTERKKAEEKLISKIEEYQTGLSTLEAKTEQNIITYRFQEAPTLSPIGPTTTPTPILTPSPIPTDFATATITPLSLPSSQPKSFPTLTRIPTIAPTLTSIPTVVQTVPSIAPQEESAHIAEQRKIAQTLKETKEQLHKIRKELEEKRSEEKENRAKRNENENNDKENKESKENRDSSDGHK